MVTFCGRIVLTGRIVIASVAARSPWFSPAVTVTVTAAVVVTVTVVMLQSFWEAPQNSIWSERSNSDGTVQSGGYTRARDEPTRASDADTHTSETQRRLHTLHAKAPSRATQGVSLSGKGNKGTANATDEHRGQPMTAGRLH